jgi:hypothetical protein
MDWLWNKNLIFDSLNKKKKNKKYFNSDSLNVCGYVSYFYSLFDGVILSLKITKMKSSFKALLILISEIYY